MSNKTHCDVCDVVLQEVQANGHVDIRPLDEMRSDGNRPMDLCPKHYQSFKEAVHEWKRIR